MGELHDRLADRDDLSGFGPRRRDHAVGVGLEIGIGELVAGEVERAAGAPEAAFGFVVRRLLAVVFGDRRVAARLQRGVAVEIGRGLRKTRGGRGKLRLGALDLQAEVLRVEARDDVAHANAIADIDDALDDLAADAEAEIGFVAGADHADEFAGRGAVFEGHALDLNRTLDLGERRGFRLAAGEHQRRGKDDQGRPPLNPQGNGAARGADFAAQAFDERGDLTVDD